MTMTSLPAGQKQWLLISGVIPQCTLKGLVIYLFFNTTYLIGKNLCLAY